MSSNDQMFVPEDMADKATKYSGKDSTSELGFREVEDDTMFHSRISPTHQKHPEKMMDFPWIATSATHSVEGR